MRKEEITVEVLIAENDNVLTNGETKSSPNGKVYLAVGANEADWVEVTEEEADELIAENEEQEDGEIDG